MQPRARAAAALPEVGSLPLPAPRLPLALQFLGFTCGNIQTPWITFYRSDSNWSSRKF